MTTPHFVVDLSNPFLQWRPIVVVLHLNLKRINCGFISFIRRGINPIGFLYKTDPTEMSIIDMDAEKLFTYRAVSRLFLSM